MDLNVTPTEIALRRRIAQLEAKVTLLEREYSFSMHSFGPPEKVVLERSDFPREITLLRRAQLSANVMPHGRVQVEVKGTSDEKQMAVAYYIDAGLRMSNMHTIDLMAEMHGALLHNLAAFLKEAPRHEPH